MSNGKRVLLAAVLLISVWVVARLDPTTQDRTVGARPPSFTHWMGADDYGRDVFSRFVVGGAWSLSTGAAATALALGAGWLLGAAAGWFGGWTDRLIMGFAELFLSVPWLFLLVGLRAALPLEMAPRAEMAVVLATIALLSWAKPARLVRSVTLTLAGREYVLAARAFGARGWDIFRRHIVPGTARIVAVQGMVLLPRFVLAEMTLAYLGLGAGDSEPGWGGLLIGLRQAYLLTDQWWRALPAVWMFVFFAACGRAAQVAARRIDSA
jgi:peptide/nickel transport system permease protein